MRFWVQCSVSNKIPSKQLRETTIILFSHVFEFISTRTLELVEHRMDSLNSTNV